MFKKNLKKMPYKWEVKVFALISTLITYCVSAEEIQTELSFEQAIALAQKNDLWLKSNQYSQQAIESKSLSVAVLPDPKVSIGLANIAADSFDFNQERMTQFKMGVSQLFPRGDSLALKQRQLQLLASQFPFQRLDRKAKLEVNVGQLWLDIYQSQQSILLMEKNRVLFEQLVDIVQSSYSTAVGKTRQQDLIRAQLELTRLDDRLFKLYQKQRVLEHKLSEWLNTFSYENDSSFKHQATLNNWRVSETIPKIKLLNPSLYKNDDINSQQILFEYFSIHPAVLSLQQAIKSSNAGVDLAKQKYKPEWGVNASYGYRENDPFGNQRSDLFSVGVTFDVPIFTSNKQDKEVESAVYQKHAEKTKKWMVIRNMIASFNVAKAKYHSLSERLKLFEVQLLPMMHQQSEASLTAYTNDDGDFAEVIRARISDLNASIKAIEIEVELHKTTLQLNYFFTTDNSKKSVALTQFGEKK